MAENDDTNQEEGAEENAAEQQSPNDLASMTSDERYEFAWEQLKKAFWPDADEDEDNKQS